MKSFLLLIILLIILASGGISLSQASRQWFVDETNQTGILARAHGGILAKREFLVAFEFENQCQPMFSSIKMQARAFGTLLRVSAFPPEKVFLTINGVRHTWHGAHAEYSGGREIGIGITQAAWNALLSNPARVSFTELDGQTYDVPVGRRDGDRISAILQQAADLCLKRLRK